MKICCQSVEIVLCDKSGESGEIKLFAMSAHSGDISNCVSSVGKHL